MAIYYLPLPPCKGFLKAASSENLLNDVIAGQNDPTYKLLPSLMICDLNYKINSPGQATNKILKTNNYNNQ